MMHMGSWSHSWEVYIPVHIPVCLLTVVPLHRLRHVEQSLCDCTVHQHFSGVLRSQLACVGCGSASRKFDPFLDVSLSLTDGLRTIGKSENGEGQGREERSSGPSSAINLESLLLQYADKRN
uniref:Uncharacterized protein n=1 Tax=Hyaloperonospora arabidopsidis (strain Emoy2) TaxID=559515 RepID=M4BJW2_HYAAE